MTKLYLFVNALFYAGFAVWCTVKYGQTSKASGYLSLDNSGRSEYLVIYGGLQAGLTFFFAYLALHPEQHRLGLIFSLSLYIPIVLYRLTTILVFRPVSSLTLMVGSLEGALLIAAAILMWKSGR